MKTSSIRPLTIHLAILSALAFGSVRIASAQPGAPLAGTPGFTLAFDEQGTGILNGFSNPGVPVSGGGLQYFLPGPVTAGFVLVADPIFDMSTANPNGNTDLLTFSNQINSNGQTVGVMLFESLIDDVDSFVDPADVPTLNFLQPVITILETGPEGNNGFQWIAGTAIYNGISDGFLTPEPSTFVMSGLGLLSLVTLAYRRPRLSKLAVVSLLLVAMVPSSAKTAFAQAPGTPVAGTPGFTLTFDEQGNSLLNGGFNPNTVFFIPGGGIQYYLPGQVAPGDVLVRGLSDVNAINNGISDLLSFSNLGNQGILTYFSLIDDNDAILDAADVATFNTVTPFGAIEFGAEGLNSFQWIPDPTNLFGSVYNGISDGLLKTPEPSTFVLGGLGFLSLAVLAYRRRSTRTG